jgi:hypothetical protein
VLTKRIRLDYEELLRGHEEETTVVVYQGTEREEGEGRG